MLSTYFNQIYDKGNKNEKLLLSFSKDFIVGYIAKGIVETIKAPYITAMYKLPYQAPDYVEYKGLKDFYIRYTKKYGVLSLWKNNIKNLNYYHFAPTTGLNFAFKDYFKKFIVKDYSTQYQSQQQEQHRDPFKFFFGNFLSGGLAGFTTSLFFYPIEYCRHIGNRDTNGPYIFKQTFKSIFNKDGIFGFYKGFGMSSILVFSRYGLLFGGYDTAKYFYLSDNSSFLKSWLIAHVISNLTDVAVHPLGSIRRRMLMYTGREKVFYTSSIDCFKKIIKQEGIHSLFKGSFFNFYGVTGGLVLVFYDKIQKLLIN